MHVDLAERGLLVDLPGGGVAGGRRAAAVRGLVTAILRGASAPRREPSEARLEPSDDRRGCSGRGSGERRP
ncbi:hypothetical protein [Nonomuraea salmonea]|uniref:hypothetical protein n=1 Tax=Nonomuraea salmonea TaxID=46181 RepID=UPI002FEBFB37